MKKRIIVFISVIIVFITVITIKCLRNRTVKDSSELIGGNYDPGYTIEGRVTKIIDQHLVLVELVNVLRQDLHKGDNLAIQCSVSYKNPILEEEPTEYQPLDVTPGDIVTVHYFTREKRNIDGVKDCNYIDTYHLLITPKEEYKPEANNFAVTKGA